MTTTNSFSRQPTNLDYASPTQFKFNILKLPKVEFFCTAVNIPGITLGTASMATPLKDIPLPGDKLSYDPLNMTFLVDENLENWQEIHGWIRGLGFSDSYADYRGVLASGADRFPGSDVPSLETIGKTKYGTAKDGGTFSDATLTVLSSKNNSIVEVRFSDLYPISITGLNYDQQPTDVDYLTASVVFGYKIYNFASVNSATTSLTTS
tara:strand:+ start:63 stop:686 length:624 start_codon:yes stop_codon:yes gene_type:complete